MEFSHFLQRQFDIISVELALQEIGVAGRIGVAG